MRSFIKTLLLLLLVLVLGAVGFLVHEYRQVTREAGARIERGAIDRVIASESPVLFDDGRTAIGVFFEQTHRRYVPYKQIPKVFVKALIAAEDRSFFEHPGFDLKAIARALIANFRSGKVVQGGSTITQQTAKNVFQREKRTYRTKLKELIQAFLLERSYRKEEILEMYVNQFFVTGYGKGVGVAARYFFDKPVEELDLVEAAFIAGSLKAPSRYNPFIQKTAPEQLEARVRAKQRKDYVLGNMLELHLIAADEYQAARDQEVPFSHGRISYDLNVILDYVREQLETDYFQKVLEAEGIDNIATSGIRIHTSVNREIQQAALRSLQDRLAGLDVRLAGLQGVRRPAAAPDFEGTGASGGDPFLARLTHLDPKEAEAHLLVSWDQGEGAVDFDGLQTVGEAWLQWKEGRYARFGARHVAGFLENFAPGDLVAVRLLVPSQPDTPARLQLTALPDLQGGVAVLHQGLVKALVGGFRNRHFNRAADARRQLGSVFKPLLFAAALKLKWNTLDALPNVHDVYTFENTTYLPRPDHPPATDAVSLAWAGTKSENLACVWLLYHLSDPLTLGEFRELVDLVGLGRRPEESYEAYRSRIRDFHGVVVDDKALRAAAFELAKKEIESDLIFSGNEAALTTLSRLHFSLDPERMKPELPEQQDIRRFSFGRLQALENRFNPRAGVIAELLERLRAEPGDSQLRVRLQESLHGFYGQMEGGRDRTRILYAPDLAGDEAARLFPLTPEWLLQDPARFSREEVWLDGLLSPSVLDLLRQSLDRHLGELRTWMPYDLEALFRIRDFRVLVHLHYVVRLARQMGISSPLEPVLSFPLGPNAVSVLEAARVYQCIMTGQSVSLGGAPSLVPIVTRITDRNGKTLWEYQHRPERVLSRHASALLSEVLRQVMQHGTGRSAADAVQVRLEEKSDVARLTIPVYGKTGTAERFTNSSFVGYVPGPDPQAGQLNLDHGYVVAAYVGYDDNRPMKTKNLEIYGASGALPVWVDIANAIVNRAGYANQLPMADLVFSGSQNPLPGELQAVTVSALNGLPDLQPRGNAAEEPSLYAHVSRTGQRLELLRRFEPGWSTQP